jgi:hypothetical protein
MLKALIPLCIAAIAWGSALAQVPLEVRKKLQAGEVVTRDAHVYAMATGIQRGTLEGTRELLVTRAMQGLANRLCAFEATPGRRLEATLQGVSLVLFESRGNELVVFIKAPLQNPACQVRVVEPGPALTAVPPTSEATRHEGAQPRQVQSVEPPAQDILIRKFGVEY